MEWILLLVTLVLVGAAVLVFLASRRQREKSGLPPGRVVYSDMQPVGRPEKPLYDPELGLTGRPDYLTRPDDAGGALVPVEVKSAAAPAEPHAGHRMQLLAYCRLVEATTGTRPPYGLLRYRNRTFAIDYTPAAEQELRAVLDEIHADQRRKSDPPRSHDQPARCAACGFRSQCDQSLA